MGRGAFVVGLSPLLLLLLSGCMLISGERASEDLAPTAGNRDVSFVSAEGEQTRTLATGAAGATVRVIVTLEAAQGELQLDVLNPDGEVAVSVRSRPDDQVTRSGTAATNAAGEVRYRVAARGARDGGYQILYQRQ